MLGVVAASTAPHLFWITSRAAGTAALLLSSVAVCLGLVMGLRLVKRRGFDLRVTHEALSLATMAAIAIHAGSLLGDSYLKPSVLDVTVPFASGYRTGWTTAGIVAGWALLALGLSYYARKWIGAARWRRLHRLTVLAWALGLAHSLGEGTDAGTYWFIAMTTIVTLPALLLLAARTSARARRREQATPAAAAVRR